MSGNSCWRPLQTAPIVNDFVWRGGSSVAPDSPFSLALVAASSVTATSAREIRELVLADLEFVAVLELVRLDPAAIDVGPVQGAGVVQVPLARSPHEHGVIARDRHVV